ncbi:hypothetical protein HBI56_027940 [Parastagonospora nodorum]|uniref:Lysine-specific metallo-endopeptidase domain-containing protein n=2 Tax=Phaeosphaeria nodorum (strain SN15 / ATCC MYA-4574 / FGSC 10173) TaxID=321614 RepID=A0A7U2EYF6_PHANO|nr:hypothetical protein HBH56_015610 [Parastagonospora nodorum]QRC95032.1 hypothetical protein JI435_027640 [Parastagonospora nodorum SN15]KAH3937337.1 hypothetical protein HBH54_018830 [Parastagonospora nodorum]KAH3953686.1 hypothetical protein HBH53_031240 [Parastagonospora nodorum]KAH3969229.1 hypothetical protein HBH51_123400 [Parastagonospora nodorum]
MRWIDAGGKLVWATSPSWPGRDLWIHVRCSGGDNTGDPDNKCGDRKDVPVDNPQCPPPPEDGAPKEQVIMQAHSDQSDESWSGGYSRITFCNRFFNELRTLDETTQYAKRSAERKENLENWDNRASCFFHEITHLAYFVNSGASGKSPNVDDLRINFGTKTKRRTEDTYGPYLAKILRNFRADGWYPGQNADTYAWYAMAMWAQKEIGHYPENPKSKGIKPIAPPRRADGSSLNDPAGAADSSDDKV